MQPDRFAQLLSPFVPTFGATARRLVSKCGVEVICNDTSGRIAGLIQIIPHQLIDLSTEAETPQSGLPLRRVRRIRMRRTR